jgi:hypothetical protein
MSDELLPGAPTHNGILLRSRVSHDELFISRLSREVSDACDRFWERRGKNKFGGVGEYRARWNGTPFKKPEPAEKGVAQ